MHTGNAHSKEHGQCEKPFTGRELVRMSDTATLSQRGVNLNFVLLYFETLCDVAQAVPALEVVQPEFPEHRIADQCSHTRPNSTFLQCYKLSQGPQTLGQWFPTVPKSSPPERKKFTGFGAPPSTLVPSALKQ